ncbi:MAG: PLP-dependent aminotransferase family protein [Firmicutes bacterium]|nr:PLP-dependent aminotransferase family protein [Bacillota bacterium]
MAENISIHLEHNSSVPLYMQIAQQLTEQIRAGNMVAGSKLPAIRTLAAELKVNTVTIVKAYEELKQAKLAVSRAGSGTYVAPGAPPTPNFISAEDPTGLTLLDQGQLEIPPGTINFASATPDPDLLPVTLVKQLINQVIDRDGGNAFAYEDSRGYPPLRAAVAAALTKLGIKVSSNNIQVISGAQQGIDIIAKSLINPGDTVLVEEPTYPGALAAFRSRGARIAAVPLQEDGPDLNILQHLLATTRPRFFYLMPAFQNPTGVSYSREKKEGLLQIAARYHLTIVEDDYLRELSFNQVDLTPLAALAPPEVPVLYLKSFSKVLLPGLRLAFLVVPPAVGQEILTAKHTSDIFTSGLFQRVFELLLRDDIWEQQMTRVHKLYKERYLTLITALRQELPPSITFSLPAGGLNFWLRLPDNQDSFSLYQEALKEGVIIAPGSTFTSTGRPSPYFRLTYASSSPAEIKHGVTRLATACRRLLGEIPQPDYMPFV